jgi:hypothetical protein
MKEEKWESSVILFINPFFGSKPIVEVLCFTRPGC